MAWGSGHRATTSKPSRLLIMVSRRDATVHKISHVHNNAGNTRAACGMNTQRDAKHLLHAMSSQRTQRTPTWTSLAHAEPYMILNKWLVAWVRVM